MLSEPVHIYTDGACSGNPGPGGFGVIMVWKGKRKEISKGYRLTTNNRMELMACIMGLEALKNDNTPVIIYSDSKYVCDAILKKWLFSWHMKGYNKIKNPDLWIRFYKLYKTHEVKMVWIKGHAGHPMNEACDRMAVASANSTTHLTDSWYETNIQS